MAAYRFGGAAGRLIGIILCSIVIAGYSATSIRASSGDEQTIEHHTSSQQPPDSAGDAAKQPTDSSSVALLQTWHGDYPVSQLERFPEAQRHWAVGFIDNAASLANLWEAFKPGEGLPDIDFKGELVLFARNTQFYNRIAITQVKLVNGVAQILAMETMSAMPIEDKVALSLARVSRHGITAILTPQGPVAIPGQRAQRVYVFECESGYHFTASIEGKKAWLFLPGRTVNLPQLSSEPLLTYGDGTIRLRVQGENAEFETDDSKVLQCTNNRVKAIWEAAKLRGVDFRATGNEPGWHLEIAAGRNIVFTTDYGNAVYTFSVPMPVTDQKVGTTSYKVLEQGHSLTVLLEVRQCQDTMGDEHFGTTVTVTLDGKTYRGCGRALH